MNNNTCSICSQHVHPGNNKNGYKTECGHLFHRKCLTEWATLGTRTVEFGRNPYGFLNNNPSCPICRSLTIRSGLIKDIIQHQKKLDDAIKLFEEAYMRTRYSGKFPHVYLLPDARKSNVPVKTYESMASFVLHVLFYRNKQLDNDNMEDFIKTFLSVIHAYKKFEYVFTGSFGIPAFVGRFSATQQNRIKQAFAGKISNKDSRRLIKYVFADNEVLEVLELIEYEMSNGFPLTVKRGNGKFDHLTINEDTRSLTKIRKQFLKFPIEHYI